MYKVNMMGRWCLDEKMMSADEKMMSVDEKMMSVGIKINDYQHQKKQKKHIHHCWDQVM